MAYEVNQGDQPQQVAGSSPLSQGGSAPAAQPQRGAQPSGQPSTPATIQTGASVNQAASQGAAQNKKSGSASSGMFTNVQKYVERNRPQAQKIAKAVTQDFSKQAGQIAQQVNKQKEDQQAKLAANQQMLDAQREEAENIVSGVMGTGQQAQQPEGAATTQQPTDVPTPTPEEQQAKFQADVDRFQALSKGPVGVQQVGDLNLAQQNLKAQALSRLAQGANREGARRQMMQKTFGDRQYTRGQSALDDLILGGSQAARESIIEGTQGETKSLRDLIYGTQETAANKVQAQREQIEQFGDEVKGFATKGQEDVDLYAEQTAFDTSLKNIQEGNYTDEDLQRVHRCRRPAGTTLGPSPTPFRNTGPHPPCRCLPGTDRLCRRKRNCRAGGKLRLDDE